MFPNAPITALWLALLSLLSLPLGAAAEDGSIFVIGNALVEAEFTLNGKELELTAMTNKGLSTPASMDMAPGSGGWTTRLVNDGGFSVKQCDEGTSQETEWFEIDATGLADWNTDWSLSPPVTVSIEPPLLDTSNAMCGPSGSECLVATWTGTITQSTSAHVTPFTVTTRWTAVDGEPFIDTLIRVSLDEADPPFYTTSVLHPDVRVLSLQDVEGTDALVVPWLGGSLITTPTDDTTFTGPSGDTRLCFPFPDRLARGPNFFPVNMAAYYDGRAPESNCLVVMTTDADDYWKDLLIDVGPDLPLGDCYPADDYLDPQGNFTLQHCLACTTGVPNPSRWVSLTPEHIPDDLFADHDYITKEAAGGYEVRLAMIEGDWWDAAEAYRRLLRTANGGQPVAWYEGPVGAATNTMPPAGKQLAGQVLLNPAVFADHQDTLARQTLDLTRILGPNIHCIYYGSHAPDRFELWYYGDAMGNTGYLPGRPSLAAAVREGQRHFNHQVSVYWNASTVVDCTTSEIPEACTWGELGNAQSSFLWDEDLRPHLGCSTTPFVSILDPASTWWKQQFIDDLLEIVKFTGIKAIYLDNLLRGPCFRDTHLHEPGGGNYMNTHRVEQIAGLQQALSDEGIPELIVAMEHLAGRMAGNVHLMNMDPSMSLLSGESWSDLDVPDGGFLCPQAGVPTEKKPMANARTIPLFRAIFDNVKIASLGNSIYSTDPGRRSWVEATHVITFGMLPSITRNLLERIPIFSDRMAYATSFSFLGSGAYGSKNIACGGTSEGGVFENTVPDNTLGLSTPDNGDLSTTDIFGGSLPAACDDSFNAPLFHFMKGLTALLKEQTFLTWHNGTIRRPPAFTVVRDSPFLHGVPGVEVDALSPFPRKTPIYTERTDCSGAYADSSYLVPGMFQAPPDAAGSVQGQEPILGVPSTWTDAGSLAFLVANPWISPDDPGLFRLTGLTFVPEDYPGWNTGTVYSVQRHKLGVPFGVLQAEGVTGDWQLPADVPLAPGDVYWWVFRKQAP